MRRLPPRPTLGELVSACEHNKGIAERQLQATRERMRSELLGPGPDLDGLRALEARFLSDFNHWADYVGYYRLRVSAEGADAVPSMAGLASAVREWKAPARDPRLPREPGDDDEGLVF